MSLEQKTYITGIIDGNGKYSYELLKAKKEFYQRFIKWFYNKCWGGK